MGVKYSKQDIIRLVDEEDVEFIRLQFTDIYGNFKNLAVTTSQLTKVLEHKCVFDGAAVEGFTGLEQSDLYLYPDLDTFTIFPWRPQQGKVARIICDIYLADGTPFDGDPRNVLKRVVNSAKEFGVEFEAGPECEFFLFSTDESGELLPISEEKGGYFDVSPLDSGENVRREIVLSLEDMGFEVESSFHEDAPGQHEIDFKHDNVLNTADNIMTFKMAVRTIAKRHGYHATFMPKPVYGIKGSGMHLNFFMKKDGKDMFADKTDTFGLSRLAYQFIAGMMEHMNGIMLIQNPIINSYKRLIHGFEAPVDCTWSKMNRSSLIRIPSVSDDPVRIELRSPDPAANPYLVLAVCMAAGIDGIKRKLIPPADVEKNVFQMTEQEKQKAGINKLPADLKEAILEFEKDSFVQAVLGEHVFHKYLKEKKREWQEYCEQVTMWETKQYLHRI